MNEDDFEGTIVLERIAEIGKIDAFWEAINDDNFEKVKALMKRANIDSDTISIVLKKMNDAE